MYPVFNYKASAMLKKHKKFGSKANYNILKISYF